MEDLRACDLLIVLGTSLKVYPFAGLVNDVSSTTPRLLFNKDEVGPFKGCNVNPAANQAESKLEANNNSNTVRRDIAWLGECDEGVTKLVELLGWQTELKNLMNARSD